MDNLIFAIKNQVYETAILLAEFCKKINPLYALVVFLVMYLIFFRKWTLRSVLSFCLTMFLLFLIYVRIDSVLATKVSDETAYLGIGIFRVISGIVFITVVMYYSFIKE